MDTTIEIGLWVDTLRVLLEKGYAINTAVGCADIACDGLISRFDPITHKKPGQTSSSNKRRKVIARRPE